MKGIEDSMIMTLRRWRSNAYQRENNQVAQMRIPQEHLAQLSSHIATPVPPANLQVFHLFPEDLSIQCNVQLCLYALGSRESVTNIYSVRFGVRSDVLSSYESN